MDSLIDIPIDSPQLQEYNKFMYDQWILHDNPRYLYAVLSSLGDSQPNDEIGGEG